VDPSGLCRDSWCGNLDPNFGLLKNPGVQVACLEDACVAEAAIAAMALGAGAALVSPGQQAVPHGNSLDSQRQTSLYQLTDVTSGAILKYGITSEPNPTDRYSAAFYAATNSQMQVIATYQNRIGARIGEIGANIGYYYMNGQLPPLTKVP
jgi:hypothetical protein